MSRVNIIAVVVMVFAVIWVFMLGDEKVYNIQQRALAMAKPFLKTRNQIEQASEALSQPKMSYQELKEEYDRLLLEVEQRRIETQALEQLYEENRDLREALQFRKGSAFELTAAEMLGRETATWYHTMIINKGAVDGIKKDDPVVVPLGLVGKVTLVEEETAVVLLLTDESCKVTARVIGTKQRGIIEGQEQRTMAQGEVTGERGAVHDGPTLRLRYLEKSATNVAKGMEVFTSGHGGIFPPNLYLGKVIDVFEGEVTSEAEVQPEVDFENLRFVFVITGMKQ